MDSFYECIIAGGPQHGLVYRRRREPSQPTPMAVVTEDGQLCTPAARKYGSRVVLLHPQATGEQFLTILAA
ncbi:hypothetical protein [Frateuria sp. STR12]|uniref:hypothetical protein n=1 Tax=Frateuria hangzhouensis TaxID=2995589 RepID=UPI002260D5E5|nr:hypothetical protein [Frateuria sp. STR12]MCX7514519.1 hypothetical protein [Frateuria sp. STR12]